MSGYDIQQICRKWGHQVTDRYHRSPGKKHKFCDRCGSETMMKCDYCNEEIKGYYHNDSILDLTGSSASVPSCCEACGKPFPWKLWFDVKNTLLVSISPLKYLIDSVVKVFAKK